MTTRFEHGEEFSQAPPATPKLRGWQVSTLGYRIIIAMVLAALVYTGLSTGLHVMLSPGFDWSDAGALRIVLSFALITLLKTMVIGMFMLFIFERLTTRTLRHMVAQVDTAHWRDPNNLLAMDQDGGVLPNEVSRIVATLERLRHQARDAFSELECQTEEMTRLNQSLQQANKEQADLTHALSHDLISPVNTLDMLHRELRDYDGQVSREFSADVADMGLCLARLRRQVQAVQRYARVLESPARLETVDLDTLIDEVQANMADQLSVAQRVTVEKPLGRVTGDPAMLSEFFREALVNCVAYRDTDRPLVIQIQASSLPTSCTRRIEVTDNGRGIAPVYLERVTGLFHRLHTYGDVPGNGLGLPICRKIAERNGGSLKLRSTLGQGTILALELNGLRA